MLQKVYPNLEHCLGETVTAHEDSEVGRCLRKFVGVQCPWGYEVQNQCGKYICEISISLQRRLFFFIDFFCRFQLK